MLRPIRIPKNVALKTVYVRAKWFISNKAFPMPKFLQKLRRSNRQAIKWLLRS